MKLEPGKTYRTAGNYVITIIKDGNNLISDRPTLGENKYGCTAKVNSSSRLSWIWQQNGTITGLTEEWSNKLTIVEELTDFHMPEGYEFADKYPRLRQVDAGEYYCPSAISYVVYVREPTAGRYVPLRKINKDLAQDEHSESWPKYYKRKDGTLFRHKSKYIGYDKNGYIISVHSDPTEHPWNCGPGSNPSGDIASGFWVEVPESEVKKFLSDNQNKTESKEIVVTPETAKKIATDTTSTVTRQGFKVVNYFMIEPITNIAKLILKSARYAICVGTLTTGFYAYSNPEAAKEIIKSCLPKVTIESPEILKS